MRLCLVCAVCRLKVVISMDSALDVPEADYEGARGDIDGDDCIGYVG